MQISGANAEGVGVAYPLPDVPRQAGTGFLCFGGQFTHKEGKAVK